MGSNWTCICGGVAVALPVLLDSAANRAPRHSEAAYWLRAVAFRLRLGVDRLHLPLLNDLARLCCVLI